MTLTRYDTEWVESSRMWEVFNIDTHVTVAWFEYGEDADNHSVDLNMAERFEEDMAALRGEEF